MSERPVVYLVDDDEAVRRALTRVLVSAGHAIQAFASARAFLDACRGGGLPGCLVLDVSMPGLTGLDLQGELNAAQSMMPIIFVTGHGDVPTSVRAMKAGAIDFLSKPVHDTVLLQAVERALARAVHDFARDAELTAVRGRLERLTPREREVLALVVAGLLNKQIASRLGTVEKTIKVHRARVMEKLEVSSLAELVRLAAKAGIPAPARP